MGLVALTLGSLALGAYIGRDMSGRLGILFFVAGFGCIIGLVCEGRSVSGLAGGGSHRRVRRRARRFPVFGTLDSVPLRQMGVSRAGAVALDATIIRGILLPATMKLLGDWNWWLPRKLDWLPSLNSKAQRPGCSHTPPPMAAPEAAIGA
jgi:hypothetical protein